MTWQQGQGNETHSFFDVRYNILEHIFKERQMGWRDIVTLGSLRLPHWRKHHTDFPYFADVYVKWK